MSCNNGDRRYRASIYEITDDTVDSGNNPLHAENLKGTRWAALRSPRGNEFIAGNQVQETITHVVTMHNDSITRLITPSWIIKIKTRTFQILETPDYDLCERPSVRLVCMEIIGGT